MTKNELELSINPVTLTWSDSINNLFKVLQSAKVSFQRLQTFEDESHDVTFRTKQDLNTFRAALKEMKEATK